MINVFMSQKTINLTNYNQLFREIPIRYTILSPLSMQIIIRLLTVVTY